MKLYDPVQRRKEWVREYGEETARALQAWHDKLEADYEPPEEEVECETPGCTSRVTDPLHTMFCDSCEEDWEY